MTLSSFSDIIVSITLIVNAVALTRNPPTGAVKEPLDTENESLLDHDVAPKNDEAVSIGISLTISQSDRLTLFLTRTKD